MFIKAWCGVLIVTLCVVYVDLRNTNKFKEVLNKRKLEKAHRRRVGYAVFIVVVMPAILSVYLFFK